MRLKVFSSPEFKALNESNQLFVAEYFVDLDPRAAYARAGYEVSEETALTNPYRLLRRADVAAIVALGMAELLDQVHLTPGKILRDLEETRLRAMGAGNYHAAIRATQLQAGYLNAFPNAASIVPEMAIEDIATVPTRELARKVLFSLMLGMRRGEAASGVPAAPTVLQ